MTRFKEKLFLIKKAGATFALAGALFVVNTAVGQDKAEQTVRRVASAIIKKTNDAFIDSRTKKRFDDINYPIRIPEVYTVSAYHRWYYGNGVMLMGMMETAKVLKDSTYFKYASHNFSFIFKHLPYFKEDYLRHPKRNTEFAAYFRMDRLDDCGAMAASLAEICNYDPNKDYLHYLKRVSDYILFHQTRLHDGTFARRIPRPLTVWADDLYMSVIYLSKMGSLTKDKRYYDEAIQQVINFQKRLWDLNTHLYYHCWYEDVKMNGVAHWLRSNGWIAMAQVELISSLPKDFPRRNFLKRLLLQQIVGFSRYQGPTGLWHQLIDKPDSYLETSGSAMFVYAVAKAVNEGLIDKSYISIALNGFRGLTEFVSSNGDLKNVCVGTGVQDDIQFYYNRPKSTNDIHGLGPLLLAGCEIIKYRRDAYQRTK